MSTVRTPPRKALPRVLNLGPEDLDVKQENLDCHICPRCKWSFSKRIPRALDCGHSFFFCENCLRTRHQIKCAMCRAVTPIKQNLEAPKGRYHGPDKSGDSSGEDVHSAPTLPTILSTPSQDENSSQISNRDIYVPMSPMDSYDDRGVFAKTTPNPIAAVSRLQTNVAKLRLSLDDSKSTAAVNAAINGNSVDSSVDLMAMANIEKQIKTYQESNSAYEVKCSQLQSKLSEMAVANSDLEAKNQVFQAHIEALSKELQMTKRADINHSSDLGKFEKQNDALRSKNRELRITADKYGIERSEMEAKQKEMHNTLQDFIKRYRDVKARHEKAMESVSYLQMENDKLLNENRRVNSMIKNNVIRPVMHSCRNLSSELSGMKESVQSEIYQMSQTMDQSMSQLLQRVSKIECEANASLKSYITEQKLRRKYFNMVQELKGNIRVFCRIRPLLRDELSKGDNMSMVCMDPYSLQLQTDENSKKGPKSFEFDRVFSPNSTQEEVFVDTQPLITSVLDGFNCCIFAFGQTGSGKTYTMEGSPRNRGVNYRAIAELFNVIDSRRRNFRYTLKLSMLEVYNEQIRDLLVDKSTLRKDEMDVGRRNKPVYLTARKCSKDGSTMVDNLSERKCQSMQDVIRAIEIGGAARSVGVTNMNEHSSRSHSILSINVSGENVVSGDQQFGKLHLIDLAGSERTQKSGVNGDRMKEAQNINKSLSALGNVINSIRNKDKHIPYRDSKLTFLLQDSLGGQSKTLMFVNVSPSPKDCHESFCSLKFAARAHSTSLGAAARNTVSSNHNITSNGNTQSSASSNSSCGPQPILSSRSSSQLKKPRVSVPKARRVGGSSVKSKTHRSVTTSPRGSKVSSESREVASEVLFTFRDKS